MPSTYTFVILPEVFAPVNAEEAAEWVRSAGCFRIEGTSTKSDFGNAINVDQVLSTRQLCGIVEWSPDDLVVVVRSGTSIHQLQEELKAKRQWLPIPPALDGLARLTAGLPGTVGGLVASNLPTRWDSATKGVRYWVLGMQVIRPNGEIVKVGSKAVKNVAGYDVQKLYVGSWGSLGFITQVVFRVFPLGVPAIDHLYLEESDNIEEWQGELPLTVMRAPREQAKALASKLDCPWVLEPETGTLWSQGVVEPPCDGWAIRAGCSNENFPDLGPNLDLMIRIKDRIDPDRKVNPGVFGAF